jgi:hypothetical protein
MAGDHDAGQSEADVEAGRPVQKAERFYFKAGAAQEYLKARHHLNIERSELWNLIRQFGEWRSPRSSGWAARLSASGSLPMRVEVSEEGETLLPEVNNGEEINEELQF